MIPAETDLLISPFFGSGQVEYYVAKTRPEIEVRGSDLFRPVANFHKCLPVEGLQAYVGADVDRETYKQMVSKIEKVDDLTSAIWAYVILYSSFNGKFGSFVKRSPITQKGVDLLKNLALPNIHVQQQDCFEVLKNLPTGRKICLYLDPPYVIKYKHDRYYRGEKQGDIFGFHQKLAQAVRDASVPFILSINDSPEIRALYSGYTIQVLPVSYKSKSETKAELLIHNLKAQAVTALV